MKRLGFTSLSNYDDGVTVYANSVYPPYPLEDEQWINFEILVKFRVGIEVLQNEIARLKREIEELKKSK